MKRQTLINWLKRCHGDMAAVAKKKGCTRQNIYQMVKRTGLTELARELKRQWWEETEPERKARVCERDRAYAVKVKKKKQEQYKRDWRKRYWRAKRRKEARAREWARKKRETIAVIKSTRGGLDEMRHALGVGRYTIIGWLHRMGLWGLVAEIRAASKAKRRG